MSIFAISNHLKRIVKSTFFITAGGTLPLLSSVVLLIPYTDNLNTADYGALAIYISFALFVQILMNYGVDNYLSVHYYDYYNKPNTLSKFIAEVTGTMFIYGILLSLALSLFSLCLFPIIFQGSTINFWPFGFMSILTGFFNAWFRMYVNIQVAADKALKYFYFGLFNFIITILISTVLVYSYPQTLIGPMWGRLISGFIIFVVTFIAGIKYYQISFKFKFFKRIFNYASPIVIFGLITWLLSYGNNYLINALKSVNEVGIYDFASKATILLEYLAIGVLGAINPRVFKAWKQHGAIYTSPEESRIYHAYSAINIFAISISIFLLPQIIRVFINNEAYYASINYIPLFCLSFILRPFQGMLLGPIFYQKRTKLLPKIMLITALSQLIISYFLITYFDIWGAVLGFFISKQLQVIVMWVFVKNFYKIRINFWKLIGMPTLYFVLVMSCIYIPLINSLTFEILQLSIAFTLVIIVYKNELKKIPSMFFDKNAKG